MGKKRKKLALFVGQADESLQRRFITGVTKQAFRINKDVCIFSMYKKYQDTAERDKGESNIFIKRKKIEKKTSNKNRKFLTFR